MKNEITIHECVKIADQERFWKYLKEYFVRDIFPGDENCFHCSEKYRQNISALHDRDENPLHYLVFCRNGQEIGIALTVVYQTEDGKQFILEFCVFPAFRGNGTGKQCAAALLSWGRENGAKFAELNADGDGRQRFWKDMGFVPNGRDQWGVPLMLLPPQENIVPVVEILNDVQDLWNLESGFLQEVGEQPLDDRKKEQLVRAIEEKQIVFFVAKRLNRPVGICSVSPCFSTFACKCCGMFDDFYIEPAFRRQGIARLLVSHLTKWCAQQEYASILVGCSAGDVGMYQSLGFVNELGRMLAVNL